MPKITVHCLVRNEECWIWFSIMSVIDYVDEILVWDTGSTDKTVSIIKTINNPKIKFREIGAVDAYSFTETRQKMLEQTQADWIIIVDGDEVWPKKAITELVKTIREEGDKYEFFISRYYNLLGDVYHYQSESACRYKINGHEGCITIRAVNLSIPGLHYDRPHGQQGLFDKQNILIQERQEASFKFLEERYLHMTHLSRSQTRIKDKLVPKRYFKFKYELGHAFSSEFEYPEIFYLPRPSQVQSPWDRRSFFYLLNASWQTPLRMLKRTLFTLPSGY